MGFLNKKERIVDTLLTQLGRKNLAKGSLGIKYLAFTDRGSMYLSSKNKKRNEDFIEICFESENSSNDFMFFTSDDTGRNIKYNTLDYTVTPNGTVYNAIENYSDTDQRFRATIITGSNVLNGFSQSDSFTESGFASIAGLITSSSFKKLENKKYISHKQDPDFLKFSIDKNKINFGISDNIPIKKDDVKSIELNAAEPLFFDQYV